MKSRCTTCGFEILTSELEARFAAGLGKCPECNRLGSNVKIDASGRPYVADGYFVLLDPETGCPIVYNPPEVDSGAIVVNSGCPIVYNPPDSAIGNST